MAVEFEEDGTLLMNGQRVLQEDYDENYEPTDEDIRDYCKIIGLDPEKEKSLLHIAVEALKAPLPRDWKPIESADGEIYYFNFRTKESSWEHPCDSFYKEQLEREREKIRVNSGPLRMAEMGQKGLDLLPGAAGMLKAGGGRLLHNLPPLRSKATADGSSGSKLAPVAVPLLSQVNAPGLLPGTSPPQSSYLKSGAGGGRGQPAGSVQSCGASLSPAAESAESISPGLAYLKSPVQQAARPLLGVTGSRSPASFQLGNIAAQFREEEEEGSEDSPTEDEEVSDFEKKFHLEGIDAEESSDHEVSEEIARVTGRGAGKEEIPAVAEGGGSSSAQEDEDHMLQMKAYVDRLDRMSPGALSPSTTSPGQHYLKTPQPVTQQVGAGGRQSELSSGKSSALGSPRLQRPTSSYGRGGAMGLTTGGGQMVQHHIIPTQVNAASEEEREEESSSSPEHPLAQEGLISPPVSAVAPKWSIAKPPSPPQSRMPLPQSVGRRGLSQHSSPKADSPDQVEGLELALEAQAKVADMKKAHQEELDRLKCMHQKELEQLQHSLKAELQAKEEELGKERDAALAETRCTLAAEQIKEEKQLKAEKEKALEETRKRLQEEEDNEEAELHESKTNRIIKIKQQLDRDQYKEEGELRAAKEAALKELQKEIQDLRATEEDQIRKEAEKEVAELRESLRLKLEQERDALREAHSKELEREGEKGQEELKKKRVALSKEQEVELAAVALQLSKEKEERLAELRERMESELEAEKEKLKDLGERKEKAEEELQVELEAALYDKKKVLIAENEAALAELRKEHSSKLEQCRMELQETHSFELDALKRETGEAEQHLRQLKEQLEAEEQEHAQEMERRRKECRSLEEEVQEKSARLTAERSQLLEELQRVECEHEKVGALQAASAEEAGRLVAQQQRELQEAIVQQKEALAALESSRCEAELVGKQAEGQKRAIELSLSALRSQEEEACLSLQRVKEEVQQHKQQLHKLKSEQKKREKQALKKQPKKTAVGVQVDLLLDPAEPATSPPCSPQGRTSPPNFSTPKPAPAANHLPPSAGDTTQTTTATTLASALQESSASSPKAATLNYQDLTLDSEPHERTPDASKEEYVSEHSTMSAWTRPQQPHEDDSFDILHKHLDQEECAYTQAKVVVDKHRQRLAERKQALKLAEQELAHDLRKVSKELTDTHQVTLVDEVQASLKEEADSIREMEDQLSTSDQLLAKKKQKLKDIELSLMSNLETSPVASCSDTSPSVGPIIPSPKTYLRTLQERLERESSLAPKKHTHRGSRAAVKKHLFEPALTKKANSETDSSGVSSTHSLSSATDSDLELQLPTTTHHGGRPNAPSWRPSGSKQPPYGGHIDALTASLEEINGKLWQVLDRLNDQTEFSHLQQLTRQGVPPSAASAPYYPLPGHSHFVTDQHKLPLHSSDRWAQPVLHPQGIGSASSVEDELRTRWNGYFNASAPQPLQRSGPPPVESIRGPVLPRYTTPRRDALSTEERLRKEKDWLKEFRRDVALSSSRRSAASGSCLTGLSPAAERPRNVPRFILDEHNNVHLVNQR